jgi:hypothetical protein
MARLTPRDLELLSFASEHRIVLASHVQELFGTSAQSAYSRLRRLTACGYLVHRRVFDGQPGCYQIKRQGLSAIGSGYVPPRLDLSRYSHDVGLAWLWLAASGGAFGSLREIVSERRMRSLDAVRGGGSIPLGVRLGGHGPRGGERLHYPDLLLVAPGGQQIAVELELNGKGKAKRAVILAGYAADRRIATVLYLTHRVWIGNAVAASAKALGVDRLVQVQRFRWGTASGARDGVPLLAREQRLPARGGAHAERELAR